MTEQDIETRLAVVESRIAELGMAADTFKEFVAMEMRHCEQFDEVLGQFAKLMEIMTSLLKMERR